VDGGIAIRPLGPFDLELAAALHGAAFETPWTGQAFGELLAMPGSAGFLAVKDGQPAGLILLLIQPPDGEVLTLAVMPGRRRRGIATALLDRALELARQAGASRLLLEVAADNGPALGFYRRHGFRPLRRRPGYYRRAPGPPVDAEVLCLPLAQDTGTPHRTN
jgi:ribosomal-protein-alanine N-acetyltransferase